MIFSFLDFETYWSATHSLSVMLPAAYVMHPDTEIISCSMAIDDGPATCVFGEDEVRYMLNQVDWTKAAAVGHNLSGFDSMILAWRFGIVPRLWACTMAMARPKHRYDGLSLAYLSGIYGLGEKNSAILTTTKGRHLSDFTSDERADMAVYNNGDTDKARGLYRVFAPETPAREMWLIDSTVRMLSEPKFKLNTAILAEALRRERINKARSLRRLGELLNIEGDDAQVEADVRSVVMSAAKFGGILESRGVPVPMKQSPKDEEKMIPALAKTDQAFTDLLEHDDPIVRVAAETRLGAKSTLLETRIVAFQTAGAATGGALPIPVRIYGAHTNRDSGEQYNPQNLPGIQWRDDGTMVPKLTNALRLSMEAPPGYSVIVADQSGIELRVNHTLWKVESTMELFAKDPKADLYKSYAAERAGITMEEVTGLQRKMAKFAQLGLGFGAGRGAYRDLVRRMGGITLSDDQSNAEVVDWRGFYHRIVNGWEICSDALNYIAAGDRVTVDPWGLVTTEKDALVFPSGRRIRYPDLRREKDKKTGKTNWVYAHGRHQRKTYGAKLDENIVQALACDSIMDASVEFYRSSKYRPALRVHDELVYVVPTSEAEALLAELQSILRTPPKWWPALVVWSEGAAASSYGHAK